MPENSISREHHSLLKYFFMAGAFLFIGTVHGVLQVIHPVRQWLDSIGSPYGGPGHMIDPLAHAHINTVGGVVLVVMAATYYLLPTISGRPLWSQRLVEHTFWWTTLGITGFYSTLLIFGVLEGNALLRGETAEVDRLHGYYTGVISVVSTVMGMGFWVYFANLFMTYRRYRQGA